MLRVKGQDGFLPLGPELVPAAEFDPTRFTLRTILNGEIVQETTADDLIWGVAYQLADLCRTITLEPGDVILTGTPANSRPMRAGDVVEVEIDGLGRLTNTVEEWDVDLSRRRRADGGLRQHPARRPRDPRGRGGAARRRRSDRMRLHRLDHVCLRVADLDEAAPRWCLQFGLVERSRARRSGAPRLQRRALLPRARRGRPPRPRPRRRSSSPPTARSTTPARTSGARGVRVARGRGLPLRRPTPTGRAIQVMPYRPPDGPTRQLASARPAVVDGAPRRRAEARPRQLPHGADPRGGRVLHRRAGDAPLGLARRGRASGSTSTPTTT